MYKWLGNKVSGIPEISELSMSTSIDFVFSLILGKWWYNNPELLFGTLMDLANLGSNIGLKAKCSSLFQESLKMVSVVYSGNVAYVWSSKLNFMNENLRRIILYS